MEETLTMNDSAREKGFFQKPGDNGVRTNWLFEVEPYSRSHGESLSDLRDNLRLKNALRRAVENDFAPIELIENIRTMIRA
jgi:hypothetical protein